MSVSEPLPIVVLYFLAVTAVSIDIVFPLIDIQVPLVYETQAPNCANVSSVVPIVIAQSVVNLHAVSAYVVHSSTNTAIFGVISHVPSASVALLQAPLAQIRIPFSDASVCHAAKTLSSVTTDTPSIVCSQERVILEVDTTLTDAFQSVPFITCNNCP